MLQLGRDQAQWDVGLTSSPCSGQEQLLCQVLRIYHNVTAAKFILIYLNHKSCTELHSVKSLTSLCGSEDEVLGLWRALICSSGTFFCCVQRSVARVAGDSHRWTLVPGRLCCNGGAESTGKDFGIRTSHLQCSWEHGIVQIGEDLSACQAHPCPQVPPPDAF